MQRPNSETVTLSDILSIEGLSYALISNLPGGAAFVVDRNLRYLLAEGEALSVAGFKPGDLVGKTIFEVLPPDLAANYEPMYRKALAGEPFEHEHHAHGYWYISRGTPLRAENGEIYAVLAVSYDISERKRAEDDRKQTEAALRESEAKLALELADARQLQFISSQLVQEENVDALYEQILEAAIALMRSDMGSMQMLHPDRNELQLLTWKGFDPASAAFWEWVRVDSESTCGVALRTGQRSIVPDVETCELMVGSGDLDSYRRSGVRAVQTTPLICRKGRVVGMISTHWQEPHQPGERELGLLDVLARQAADLIEQRQAEAALRESEERLRLALAAGEMGTWQYRFATDEHILDTTMRQLLGLPTGTDVIPLEDFLHIVHADDRPQVQREIERCLHEGGEIDLEFRVVWQDGSVIWLKDRGKAIRGEGDRPLFLTGAATDITQRKQAEIALQESEAKYRSLFQSMDEGYAVVEVLADDNGEWNDFLFLEVNPAFEQQTGMVNSAGRKATEILGTPNPAWAKIYGRVVETGEPVRFEENETTLDRIFDLYAFRLGGAGSCRVAVLFTDVTDRKCAEETLRENEARQAFLLKLSDVLQQFVQPNDIKAAAMRLLGEHLGVSRAQYHECDFLSGEYYSADGVGYANGLPLLDLKYRIDDFGTFVNENFAAGRSYRIDDLEVDPRVSAAERDAYRTYQIRAGAGVPLIRGGKLVAILAIHDVHPHPWTDLEMDLIRETAERIWTPLERARAQEALRESEEKYRSLFESINDAFALLEVLYDDDNQPVDCRFLEVSPSFETHTTLPQAQGKTLRELIPSVESGWFEHYHQALVTNALVHFEMYQSYLNIWLEVDVLPYGNPQDRHVMIVFQNINDRKRAEAQLRRAAEMDAFRVKLSDALRSLSDAPEIQRAAMRILGEHLQVDRVMYAEIDDGETYSIAANYVRGAYPTLVGRFPTSDFGTVSEQLRAGETFVVENMTTDERLSEAARAAFIALDVYASVGVPLVKAGRWVANLGIQHGQARQWTEEDIELVQETAERTWAAVERARAEAALRESELQRVREQSAREQERQRAESLAELDRAKTAFFSNVSHEFRTPLTLSLAPLQDALSDRTHPLDPVHRERLELVHRNSLRLLKLVNTLLDFSRIEAGRMEVIYEPTDLAAYTAELASVFRSAIERAGLQLMVDCPPLPEPVFVDREMWEKIVLNLLSNAFKFTFEGEITVSMRAASRAELQASTSNVDGLTSKLQSPSSELNASSLKLDASSLEPNASSLEPNASSLKLNPWSLKLDASSLKLDASSVELNTSSVELGASLSQLKPQNSNFVILEICDTGTGIAPEHLPHLFERFYQVRGTQARTHEGSGIGLALVYELVQLHGGTIEVSSTLGEGTCFSIALPFGTDHLPNERLRRGEADRLQVEGDRSPVRTLASTAMGATAYVEETERWLHTQDNQEQTIEQTEEQTTQTAGSSLPTNTSARVLVADDNADMREYLTRILSEHVQVEAVADGATALAVAQERVPDLILSDVMMPRLDGFELLEALRADPRTREIPIILLSARAGEEAIVEGLEAGADDYLIKPFSAQELVSRVTAHLQMAQLRGEALQEARSTIRSRDEFISVVSHELNTPLVSILGWTRLLRSSPPNPVMLSKALDTIERNATLQGKLVKDLLDLSRISAGKLRLHPQPIELQPVVETAIATVAQTATDKGIDLTWQENVTEPVVVMGDSDRLSQVLINLLTNAIKFTPKFGSVRVELSVMNNDGSADASYVEIRVADTGDGIPAHFLPYVFERFRQAEGAHSAKGMGLGLAIARHIVELHNGTIQAESAGEGQGTTFTVRLPLPTTLR